MNKKHNYEVRELKKYGNGKDFFGLYLILDENQYVATVKFNFFKNVCNIFDVLEEFTDCHEESDCFHAVRDYIAKGILQYDEYDGYDTSPKESSNAMMFK